MKQALKSFVVAVLQFQARLVLKKYKPKIIAVTGSVGKTSTKDAIYSVLSSAFHVRKSEKSFNSEIGIPLTVLGCPNGWSNVFSWLQNFLRGFILVLFPHRYPRYLVVEVGADRPGDIKSVMSWMKPDVAVITKLSQVPVHVEFFSGVDALVAEKAELVRGLKEGGVLVLNTDDEFKDRFASLLPFGSTIITYGMLGEADIKGEMGEVLYAAIQGLEMPFGQTFRAHYKGEGREVKLSGVLGRQHAYPALAALAVGVAEEIPLAKAAKALAKHEPSPARMKLVAGLKETMIIDDTYNSSPIALAEALSALKGLKCFGRKIAVLGDMMELGKFSAEEHKKAGALVKDAASVLFAVGLRARAFAEGALAAGMPEGNIFQCENSEEAGNAVELMIRKGDIVLVKGSQSARMEKVVEEIMAEPNRKEELLARQDPEWQKR